MTSPHKALHHHLSTHANKRHHPSPGTANLTYYLFEGVLVGSIGRDFIHISALSGGGGGSTKHVTDDSVNNPYMYAFKEVDNKKKHLHVHGGPIPPGKYTILPSGDHKKLGFSAKLEPQHRLPNDRGGFYIHGPGPHGSDGCIVPNSKEFPDLMDKLKAANGGTLHVLQSMDGDFA